MLVWLFGWCGKRVPCLTTRKTPYLDVESGFDESLSFAAKDDEAFGVLLYTCKSALNKFFRSSRSVVIVRNQSVEGKLMKTKVIVVVNQKGGVGKSTLAFHLAHAGIEKKNARVLCLDMDSQGNLSQYLTGDLDVTNDTVGGVGLLLEGKAFTPSKSTHPQIDLLHGHAKLDRYDSDADVEAHAYSPEMPVLLRNLGYDYVIIDTPPAVGLRHLAALYWADLAIIPMEPVMSGIVGFQNVVEAIDNLILPLNPSLKWAAVMNRANVRVKSHREKDTWMREVHGPRILATLATRTAVSDAMEETPAQPVWLRRGTPKSLRDEWHNFSLLALKR